MFKSVASESTEGHESREMSRKRGAGDEKDEDEEAILEIPLAESLPISTVVSTVPATTDQFMFTEDVKRLLVGLVVGDTLMILRLATKAWKRVVDAFIDEGVRSGEFIVHDGEDIGFMGAWKLKERRKLAKRVIFLLNITKVGEYACMFAANLVVLGIPEGVERIGKNAFGNCHSLTTVYFPTTLIEIGYTSFARCFSLDNVDYLHTNLQELDGLQY
ncbi:hypothetical protein TrLO_g378 [Triparma laevis f. longispina]|uniref:Uncharacterized protein n=1 Tax=Triparma laevis f. longispina TaxID=1714387 RepID=A0A9W7CNV4_9STRA|nr:hypothetical protein TrLO_g378 [Triparma laevis f. longispina]